MKKFYLLLTLLAMLLVTGCQEEKVTSSASLCEWRQKCESDTTLAKAFDMDACIKAADTVLEKEKSYVEECEAQFVDYDLCIMDVINKAACGDENKLKTPEECRESADVLVACVKDNFAGGIFSGLLSKLPLGGILDSILKLADGVVN